MIGKQLSHYEITAQLGKGGMGEVYRARDGKLGRDVALKLLPPEFSADAERVARFEREARTLASLTHANIAAIYGFEQDQGHRFLVMELVEGQDLSERLQAGALRLEEALAFAIQIADALEAAHENGIVHRDLKPANVMLTREGTIKILDFGLARAYAPEEMSHEERANSPTITAAMTQAGTILGTAAYMSPEQARGQHIDRRADIWALGVILFELLVGKSLFEGETISDTLAAVLRYELDWDELPKETPPELRRLMRRCLQRDPRERLRDAGDVALELREIQANPGEASPGATTARKASRLPWLLAAAATIVAIVAIAYALNPREVTQTQTQSQTRTQADLVAGPQLGYDTSDLNFDLSPDGTRLAFAGLDADGDRWIYLRNLSTGDLRRLDGTQDGSIPFWSPDGDRLGFFISGALSIVGIDDGIVERDILRLNSWSLDAAWHPDDWIILIANDTGGHIFRGKLVGGEPELIYSSPDEEMIISHPAVLPDGTLMFSEDPMDGSENAGVYVLEDGASRRIVPRASNGHWVEGRGSIVFRREQRIFAQRFDPVTRELQGDPIRIGGPVRSMTFPNQAFITVSDDGTLVYLEGESGASDSELVWVNRRGELLERLDIVGDLYSLDISHDGRRVTFDNSEVETAGDIWAHDFGRRSSVRYTDHRLDESGPLWSLDDESIYFFRGADFYRVDLAGAPELVELKADGKNRRPNDAHPVSGNLIITLVTEADRDLWLYDVETGEEELWLDLPGVQRYAQFSPDGNWVAFESEHEDGKHIWIESFPDRRESFRVSDERGGEHPEWRSDGRELYYVSPSRKMMAVSVDMDATDRSPIGEPEELFPVRLRRNQYYDVGPEPDRFLLNRLTGEAATPSAVLVRGWEAEEDD